MTHRLATNCAKNYCNRTPIVKVIVENVVTCFLGGHGVVHDNSKRSAISYIYWLVYLCAGSHVKYLWTGSGIFKKIHLLGLKQND